MYYGITLCSYQHIFHRMKLMGCHKTDTVYAMVIRLWYWQAVNVLFHVLCSHHILYPHCTLEVHLTVDGGLLVLLAPSHNHKINEWSSFINIYTYLFCYAILQQLYSWSLKRNVQVNVNFEKLRLFH